VDNIFLKIFGGRGGSCYKNVSDQVKQRRGDDQAVFADGKGTKAIEMDWWVTLTLKALDDYRPFK
jgi:hypothetical protein